MRVRFVKVIYLFIFVMHVYSLESVEKSKRSPLEHGLVTLDDIKVHHVVPELKITKSKVVHPHYRHAWVPGHVVHHSFIPGHVEHVLIPTHHVVHVVVPRSHPGHVFKNHIGGFGTGLETGGHGAGHGFHAWNSYTYLK